MNQALYAHMNNKRKMKKKKKKRGWRFEAGFGQKHETLSKKRPT
jgi:hypothetical protein